MDSRLSCEPIITLRTLLHHPLRFNICYFASYTLEIVNIRILESKLAVSGIADYDIGCDPAFCFYLKLSIYSLRRSLSPNQDF